MSVSNLLSKIINLNGFAPVNRYKSKISSPYPLRDSEFNDIDFLIESINLPRKAVGEFTSNVSEIFPNKKETDTIKFNVVGDGAYKAFNIFNVLIDEVYDSTTKLVGYKSDYTFDYTVTAFNRGDVPTFEFKFYGCYVDTLDNINYSVTTPNAVASFSVLLKYKYMTFARVKG